MKNKYLVLVLLAFVVLSMPVSAGMLRVGLVLSIGGLKDESFNDAAYEGVMQLRREGDCIVEVIEPGSISSIEPALRYFCERNMDLVCAVGIFANDAVRRVAQDFPESKFVLLDSVVTVPNVLSILFDEEQGSFYAGAYAAMITKTGKVGFLGGMDSPVIASFERGFKNGVRFVKPDATVISRYLGSTPEAFDMPDKAHTVGLDMAKEGADVVYHASGKSGLGLIQASRRGNFLVIGVDSDQSRTAPGKVPASMVKRIDNALVKAADVIRLSSFEGGIWTLGLEDSGIELMLSRFNRDLMTPEVVLKLKEVEDFLIHKNEK
ncbi:MAG: BMP family ABC transporter substrate-binding protein [Candidatus Riflebacteria bacterium]|nr:BMP family ABC transporter substrate-binding protein [Candidatus Riflebacteria bacterium]